jgi:hypothetical protein
MIGMFVQREDVAQCGQKNLMCVMISAQLISTISDESLTG